LIAVSVCYTGNNTTSMTFPGFFPLLACGESGGVRGSTNESIVSTNYFQLFDLPQAFEVDSAVLQPRYHELQREFHPDRFAAEPADVQRVAVQKAADINTGFATLKEPVARARHLLALAGHAVNIESATVVDTDFLMAQMELREQLEEADEIDQLTALRAEAEEWLGNLGREFAIDYREADWSEAGDTVRKMQFMRRFIEEVSAQEARLDDAEFDAGLGEED
jgi:molecular chaperone HscB